MSDDLDDIQAIFFEECTEGLQTAEEGLAEMAAGDAPADTIDAVFRAVHSIKGGAGAFGHDALTAFSHRFENVLDEVRAGRIACTSANCGNLLTAFDVLADHVAAARGEAGPPDDAAALTLLEAMLKKDEAAPDNTTEDDGPAATETAEADEFGFTPVAAGLEDLDADEFGFTPVAVEIDDLDKADAPPLCWTVCFTPSDEALANGAEPLLVIRELERLGGTIEEVDVSAIPPLDQINPDSSYLGWTINIPGGVDRFMIEEAFDFVPPGSVIEITQGKPDGPTDPKPENTVSESEEDEVQPVPSTTDDDATTNDPDKTEETEETEETEGAEETSSQRKLRSVDATPQNIRVDVSKLDMLLNLVGELVIRNSILSDRLSQKDQQRVELPELARLTREIQDNVMALRAQPIRHAFSRVPRMLRELCATTSKQVTLEMGGEATEVDKSVIEKIGEPLTHMIRNAVDHGIESAEERLAAGKPAEGTVSLSAEQKGARILLRVSDDGRGINRERVKAKAIEKGIVPADADMTDEEIDNLICAPGFSTAETVSNISGRGVGMDVVRSNIEALGGRVEISSTPGQGTVFTMVLPLTLAILDGMVVKLAGMRYVLPLASVIETVQPEPGQVRNMTKLSEVIELRGDYVPLKRLSDLFDCDHRCAAEESVVIIVESEAGHVGLMVDTIEDRREVVIKSLDEHLYPIRGLGGATILGDGSIALILDIDALVSTTNKFNPKGIAA